MDGVWSCLYCEGVWLTTEKLNSLASACQPVSESSAVRVRGPEVEDTTQSLICPSCEVGPLEAVNVGSANAHQCPQCRGAFFKKGVLAAYAPQVFSSDQEAPVVGALFGAIGTVAMLGDPLLLVAALAYQPPDKDAH